MEEPTSHPSSWEADATWVRPCFKIPPKKKKEFVCFPPVTCAQGGHGLRYAECSCNQGCGVLAFAEYTCA